MLMMLGRIPCVLIVSVLVICAFQVIYLNYRVLHSLKTGPVSSPDQYVNPARNTSLLQSKTLAGVNWTLDLPHSSPRTKKKSNSYSQCLDKVCSSRLEWNSFLCYKQCEETTFQRTHVPPQDIPSTCTFRKSNGRDPVALVSVPGSGNTWVRKLMERATGICTGSIYCDIPLRIKGFVGEYVRDGSVLVVKTHTSDHQYSGVKIERRNHADTFYSSAILLVRNPFDTFVAERHRSLILKRVDEDLLKSPPQYDDSNKWHKDNSHIETVGNNEAFGVDSGWKEFVFNITKRWQKTIIKWSIAERPLLVVHYEDLKTDQLAQVERMLNFLEIVYNRTELTANLENGFGDFQRNHSQSGEYYSLAQKSEINSMIRETTEQLEKHQLDHLFYIKRYLAIT